MVRRIAWIFAGAGALIFAAITAALVSGDSHIRIPAIAALVTFAAIMLSHLGGIEGGLALREEGGTEKTRAVSLVLSIVPSLAAVANAVFNATGARVRTLPMTPDRVLAALAEARRG